MKIIFAIFLGFCSILYGQKETVWLGGLNIYLGMPKENLLNEIDRVHYNISVDKVLVVNSKEKPENYLGAVFFKKNKVSRVEKNWSLLGNSTIDNLNIFFTLFEKEYEKKRWEYVIRPIDVMEVEYQQKIIYFTNNVKTIKLYIYENNIQIQEILGQDE